MFDNPVLSVVSFVVDEGLSGGYFNAVSHRLFYCVHPLFHLSPSHRTTLQVQTFTFVWYHCQSCRFFLVQLQIHQVFKYLLQVRNHLFRLFSHRQYFQQLQVRQKTKTLKMLSFLFQIVIKSFLYLLKYLVIRLQKLEKLTVCIVITPIFAKRKIFSSFHNLSISFFCFFESYINIIN